MNGVEKGGPRLAKRKSGGDETEESEEEEQKTRKVFKINHVYHVSEWLADPAIVSGEPATIPVKLKEIIRLETPEECGKRRAEYAKAKSIESEKRLKFWVETDHPMVPIRPQLTGQSKSIAYAASPNCLLGTLPYERMVQNPQVFVSCIQATRKHVSSDKKVYLVVGMLVELFSNQISPVLLHSIIMHQAAPHR